jgi:hypothetical protein
LSSSSAPRQREINVSALYKLLEMPTGGTITFEGTDITDSKTNINPAVRK